MVSVASGAVVASKGGGGAQQLLASQVLGADAATVDFSGIAQTAHHLRLVVTGCTTAGALTDVLGLRFNADSLGHYFQTGVVTVNNAAPINNNLAGAARLEAGFLGSDPQDVGYATYDIYGYTDTAHQKVVDFRAGYYTGGPTNQFDAYMGMWNQLAAIVELTLFPVVGANLKAGFSAYLYGIT